MVPASKERDKHVNRKITDCYGCYDRNPHGVQRDTEKNEYPILWGAKDENLSAKVLKFWSLRGNIKFWGKTTWGRTKGTLCTRSGSLTE